MKPEISKYRTTWIELLPAKGIVTKHDQRQFGTIFFGRNIQYFIHFKDKQNALNWLNSFNKKLDKQYTCRLFTDAQFGMSENINGRVIVPFTTKQRNEVYIIG